MEYPTHIDTDWMIDANCHGIDTSLFFYDTEDEDYKEVKVAVEEICAACKVRQHCLEYSAIRGIRFGIWGGQTWSERRKFRRQLQTGEKKARHFPLDALTITSNIK